MDINQYKYQKKNKEFFYEKATEILTVFGDFGFWILNKDSKYCWRSDELCRLYEIERDTMPTEDGFHSFIHPEDRARVNDAVCRAWENGSYTISYRIVIGDKLKWVEERVRLYPGYTATMDFLVGVVQEVTNVKHEQILALQKQLELSAIMDYLGQTVNTTDITSIARSAGNTIERVVHVKTLGIFFHEEGRLVRVSTLSETDRLPFEMQSDEDCLSYRVLEIGQVLWVDAENYPNAFSREQLKSMGAKKVVAIPIMNNGKTIAAFTFAQLDEGCLSQREQDFCRTICGHLSSQLKNALLYRQLQRELADRRLVESDLNTIFNESIDFISIFSSDGFFKRVNPAFLRMMGYSENELFSRSILDFIYSEDRKRAIQLVHTVRRKGMVHGFQLRFIDKIDSVIYTEINARYVKNSDKIIAIARDMTRQRHIEKEKMELERSVELEKLKTEFFSNLSHEFKTPLHIILSSLQLLQLKIERDDGQKVKEYRRLCKYIYQNAFKLLRLCTNLMDSTRIESGYLKLSLEKGNIVETIKKTVQSVEPYAVAKKIDLSFSPYNYFDGEFAFDGDMIDRIMLNLLSNAIKNTSDGGHIRVWTEDTPNKVTVFVADDGAGISEELLPAVFDRFRVADLGLIRHCDGSGLGLSIVKALVKMHGGEIDVTSRPGSGSTFRFTISRTLSAADSTITHLDDSARKTRLKMEMADIE